MKRRQHSIASASLHLTGLFEAELLTRLMLWKWGHPRADDLAFVNDLVERAAEALRMCLHKRERLLEDVDPLDMNFVASIWYVEWAAVASTPDTDPDGKRQAWLNAVRHALPSCFCNPQDLE